MQYNYNIRGKNITSLMQQMFVVSDCLLKLGYRQLAIAAQDSNNWEFATDFVKMISREAHTRHDDAILDRLASAGFING